MDQRLSVVGRQSSVVGRRLLVVVAVPGCAAGVLGSPRDDDATNAAGEEECGVVSWRQRATRPPTGCH